MLPGISTEQLRSRLNRMVADGLLTRQRYREVPPRVDYELTDRARDLLPVVGALARWGYRWAWGPPHPGERVDVGAILRATAGLPVAGNLRGTVAVTVSGHNGDAFHAVLRAERGTLRYEEHGAEDADAHVAGSEQAWIEAFAAEGGRGHLEINGDRALADGVLDALTPAARRVAAVA